MMLKLSEIPVGTVQMARFVHGEQNLKYNYLLKDVAA